MDYTTLKEPELKDAVFKALSPDFIIHNGDAESAPQCRHFYSYKPKRPDFICWPKKHLTDAGWPKWMFYIEVKDCVGGSGASRVGEVAWQAKTYADCICNFTMPAFVLVFPGFASHMQGTLGGEMHGDWFAAYMQRERVGELFLYDNYEAGYKIKFSSQVLYDSRDKRSKFDILNRNHKGECQ